MLIEVAQCHEAQVVKGDVINISKGSFLSNGWLTGFKESSILHFGLNTADVRFPATIFISSPLGIYHEPVLC